MACTCIPNLDVALCIQLPMNVNELLTSIPIELCDPLVYVCVYVCFFNLTSNILLTTTARRN